MQLHVVIVPPAEVVRDALDAFHDLLPSAPEAPSGLLDRILGRGHSESVAPPVTSVPVDPDAVFVLFAKIGNVEAADAAVLAKALEVAARSWPAPTLHVSRLSVDQDQPFGVTAHLDGEMDVLKDLYLKVNEVARLQRIFLDRRGFRPEFPLTALRVEEGTALPDHLAAEIPYQGPSWSPSRITLLRTSFSGGQTTFSEFAGPSLMKV